MLTANVYINYAFVLIAPQAKVHVLALMYTAKHAQDELLAIILAQVAQLKSVKKLSYNDNVSDSKSNNTNITQKVELCSLLKRHKCRRMTISHILNH